MTNPANRVPPTHPRHFVFPADIDAMQADPNRPTLPYATRRPKRRRKGQLNDGEWAPGAKPKPASRGCDE